jgi:hypothetical protein
VAIFDILGGAAELADALWWIASPWRYVFSPAYRARKRAEWERVHPVHRAIQIVGGVLGALLGLAAVWILGYAIGMGR